MNYEKGFTRIYYVIWICWILIFTIVDNHKWNIVWFGEFLLGAIILPYIALLIIKWIVVGFKSKK
jgi:hypothetical protein